MELPVIKGHDPASFIPLLHPLLGPCPPDTGLRMQEAFRSLAPQEKSKPSFPNLVLFSTRVPGCSGVNSWQSRGALHSHFNSERDIVAPMAGTAPVVMEREPFINLPVPVVSKIQELILIHQRMSWQVVEHKMLLLTELQTLPPCIKV